jgi:hypothetical protein
MDLDVVQTAAAVMPYLTAAATAYGMNTLDKARDAVVDKTSDATVTVGHRILNRILHRKESQRVIEGAVIDLAAAPDDEDAQAALRLQIRKAVTDDPALLSDIAGILNEAGVTVTASGARSVAAHTISGVVVTGDGASVQR